jgi:hypothetical protein
MVTLIEVHGGYEPYWDVVSGGQYRGVVHMEELELFIKGVTDNGGEVEFVNED